MTLSESILICAAVFYACCFLGGVLLYKSGFYGR